MKRTVTESQKQSYAVLDKLFWFKEPIGYELEISIYPMSDSEWFVSAEGLRMPSLNERG
jgi:hypothetical protein